MNVFERALQAERGGVGASVGPFPFRQPRNGVGASIQYVGAGALAEAVPEITQDVVQYGPTQFIAAEQSVYGLGLLPNESTSPTGAVIPNDGNIYQLTYRPNRPINPSRFVMPSTIFGGFLNQIQIGGTDIFPGGAGNGVPWEFFSEVSTAPNVRWFTINSTPGVTFSVTVPATAPAPLPFTGAFYGTALRQ